MTDNEASNEPEVDQELLKAQERKAKYRLYVVKPEEIDNLWFAEDPSAHVQELLAEHLGELKSENKNVNAYSENEDRYEPRQELKWLGDYLVNGLILLKSDLAIVETDLTCDLLQVLWKTLDFQNTRDSVGNGGAAVHGRFSYLQEQLTELYKTKQITRPHVQGILQYVKRTLFSHLNLYLACLSAKQNRREKPLTIIASIPQQACAGGLDGSECKQIPEDEGEEHEDLGPAPEGTVKDQDSVGGEADASQLEVEEDLNVDPDDPLYGLDQRIKHSNLDDQTKAIIKTRLAEAHHKIKENLRLRQENLESKMAGSKGSKK